jgi:hypothetical protein
VYRELPSEVAFSACIALPQPVLFVHYYSRIGRALKEIQMGRCKIDPVEAEKRIRAWADLTMLSLELKRAMLRKRHPELSEDSVNELARAELSLLKTKTDE